MQSFPPPRKSSFTGAQFQCLLDIVPIKNEKHEVVLFLASHKDVSKSDHDNLSDDEELDESAESPGPGDVSNAYQRRRSRAVLYQLSGHYRRSVTVKSKLKLNNVSHTSFSLLHFLVHLCFFQWLKRAEVLELDFLVRVSHTVRCTSHLPYIRLSIVLSH